jgi:hypothetical protein
MVVIFFSLTKMSNQQSINPLLRVVFLRNILAYAFPTSKLLVESKFVHSSWQDTIDNYASEIWAIIISESDTYRLTKTNRLKLLSYSFPRQDIDFSRSILYAVGNDISEMTVPLIRNVFMSTYNVLAVNDILMTRENYLSITAWNFAFEVLRYANVGIYSILKQLGFDFSPFETMIFKVLGRRHDKQQQIRFLLKEGLKPTLEDLKECVARNNISLLELYILNGVALSDSLLAVALNGEPDMTMIRYLVGNGLQIGNSVLHSHSPLHIVMIGGHLDVLGFFLSFKSPMERCQMLKDFSMYQHQNWGSYVKFGTFRKEIFVLFVSDKTTREMVAGLSKSDTDFRKAIVNFFEFPLLQLNTFP